MNQWNYTWLILMFSICLLYSEAKPKTTTPKPKKGTTTPIPDATDYDKNTCAKDWKKKNKAIEKRFSDAVLGEHCQKGKKWRDDATEAIKHPPKPLLTASQLQWVNGVWGCKDIVCLCRLWDFCNKFLAGIEATVGNLTNSLNQFSSNVNDLSNLLTGKNNNGNTKRFKRQTLQQINDVIQDKVGKAARKDIRMMTDEERATFLRAVQHIKQEKIDNLTKYDILILYHTPEYSPEAHFCAAFFPFHRELLKNIEVALRAVEPTAALAFWDPTLDEGLPDPRDSVLWSEDFLGNGDGDVITGPFATFRTLPDSQIAPLSNSMRIVRGIGQSPFGSLLKQSDIEQILEKKTFRELVYCVDPFVELIHGTTHMWVGGHMLELRTSPNDPVFFMYHCFIDSVFERWRQLNQKDRALREKDFTSDAESCNNYCTASADMKPFPVKIIGGLLNIYTDQLYSYDPPPTCSADNQNCGSSNVFCDTRNFRCVSKVKPGGNCTGLEQFDSCYKSVCKSGRCVTATATTIALTFPPTTTTPPPPTTTTTTTTTTTSTTKASKAPGSQPPAATTTATTTTTTTTTTQSTTTTGVFVPVTESKTVAPVVKTVWVPITVLRMSGQSAQPYPDASIITTDVTHSTKLSGVVTDPAQVPYYTGAALAQVINPFSVTDRVEATLEVIDKDSKKCSSMCLNTNGTYTPCDAKITLSSNGQSNNDLLWSPNFEMAKFLGWEGNKRNPDKFLFMCKSQEPTTTTITVTTTTAAAGVSQTTAAPTTPQATQSSVIVVNNKTNGGDNININIVSITDNETSNIANGGCHNLHRCCVIWSSVGECKRNPWMQSNCEKDCNVCNGGTEVTGCLDYHPKCPAWAKADECKANPKWMEENCRKSCNVCKRPMTELLVLCGAPKNSNVCEDHNVKCKPWADSKECERNPWWMKQNCPVSCKVCTPTR